MGSPMIPEQRQKELLRLLRTAGVLSIRDITELLRVSHIAVRRDISILEASGRVVAVQGGVRLAENSGTQPSAERSSRSQLSPPRKRAVGGLAAALVEDGMVVFLDPGIMCELVVPFLAARKGITVVTNSCYVAAALFDYPQIETIHTGGTIDVDCWFEQRPLRCRDPFLGEPRPVLPQQSSLGRRAPGSPRCRQRSFCLEQGGARRGVLGRPVSRQRELRFP